MVGWIGHFSKFCGTFASSFMTHREKINRERKFPGIGNADTNSNGDPITIGIYETVTSGTKDCSPLSDHISDLGRKKLCKALRTKNMFGSHMAIRNNPGPMKREICIAVLKLASTYLCSENPSELIRAATYTALACRG